MLSQSDIETATATELASTVAATALFEPMLVAKLTGASSRASSIS